ncbi:hypothetical protein ACFC4C_38485 [Streptomyces sp. NPDC056039]|uniref:hypothetical protein n=1 Tax=Streptomyces sp. NPDC056039 TaxID=3345687 RepID=UPI0035DA8BE9
MRRPSGDCTPSLNAVGAPAGRNGRTVPDRSTASIWNWPRPAFSSGSRSAIVTASRPPAATRA